MYVFDPLVGIQKMVTLLGATISYKSLIIKQVQSCLQW